MSTVSSPVLSRRVVLAGLGVSSLNLALLSHASGVVAQEATPATEPIKGNELAPGVVAEVFAAAPSVRAPGQTVYTARFTFQPGAEIFPHSHPGTTILAVASGTFGWTLLAGAAHVIRGAASGAPEPAEDVTEPGTEVILEPGDAIYYEDDVVHTARGAGEEAAVVHATQVLTAGEPRIMPVDMDMGGTPAATPAP
jgi:quercetin dioxygenase-like cupin family protein